MGIGVATPGIVNQQLGWQVVRDSATKLDRLITHEFTMDQVAKAMDVQVSAKCGKVLLYTERGEMYR